MSNLKIVTFWFCNVLGMGLSFHSPEVPFILATLVWSIGLAGLSAQIVLYTNIK